MDFEYLVPVGLDSWRGAYDELAINFADPDMPGVDLENRPKAPTAKAFLGWLKEAVGKTYVGYKGGDFTMETSTPLWVANYGNVGETALVAIEVRDFDVLLRTWNLPYGN